VLKAYRCCGRGRIGVTQMPPEIQILIELTEEELKRLIKATQLLVASSVKSELLAEIEIAKLRDVLSKLEVRLGQVYLKDT
jgi:hypothetical protein